jgi:hypothetical protein
MPSCLDTQELQADGVICPDDGMYGKGAANIGRPFVAL